jgi:hypothetical protein
MYTDKDNQGYLSIMEISPAEAKDLGTILTEFEYLIEKSKLVSDRDAAHLIMFAAKLRFQIIDTLK